MNFLIWFTRVHLLDVSVGTALLDAATNVGVQVGIELVFDYLSCVFEERSVAYLGSFC